MIRGECVGEGEDGVYIEQKAHQKKADIQQRKTDYLIFNLFVCKYVYILICRTMLMSEQHDDGGTVGVQIFISTSIFAFISFTSDHIVS